MSQKKTNAKINHGQKKSKDPKTHEDEKSRKKR